jgi:hypothetical protein
VVDGCFVDEEGLSDFGNRPIAAEKNDDFGTISESSLSQCTMECLECRNFFGDQIKVGQELF